MLVELGSVVQVCTVLVELGSVVQVCTVCWLSWGVLCTVCWLSWGVLCKCALCVG